MNTHPVAFIVPVIVFMISIAHFVISGERPYGRDKPYANRTKIFQEFQQEMPKLTKGLGEPTRIFHAHKQSVDFVGISHSYPKSEALTQLVHTNATKPTAKPLKSVKFSRYLKWIILALVLAIIAFIVLEFTIPPKPHPSI